MDLTIAPRGKKHDRNSFDCGESSLNRYIQTYVTQDLRRKFNRIFITSSTGCHHQIVGYLKDRTSPSGCTTVAMASPIPAPPSVIDPDRYQVFHATDNFCQGYAGGGGPPWGDPVPGSGSVRTIITGPNILTNTVNDYDLSMGVSFKCEKCYTIPPYEKVRDFELAEPLPDTEGKTLYETAVPIRE